MQILFFSYDIFRFKIDFIMISTLWWEIYSTQKIRFLSYYNIMTFSLKIYYLCIWNRRGVKKLLRLRHHIFRIQIQDSSAGVRLPITKAGGLEAGTPVLLLLHRCWGGGGRGGGAVCWKCFVCTWSCQVNTVLVLIFFYILICSIFVNRRKQTWILHLYRIKNLIK